MAKTRHNHVLDTIDDIITHGKRRGVLHLYADDVPTDGRNLQINGRRLLHFGHTGYTGLEHDERVIEAGINALRRYGANFPLSKTYISNGAYRGLEERLQAIFGYPIMVAKNTTMGHMSVISGTVRDEDAVVMDLNVHSSVQNACQLLKPRGIPINLIRHNDLDMLESILQKVGNKHEKVWYMVDGVYSMFGDFVPIFELMTLMERYPRLHLYVDDVHGISWTGIHGQGWLLEKLKGVLHPRMVMMTTLSKSFGTSGAVAVFPNEEMARRVKVFGGPLTFSGQTEPATLAMAAASADIHLSDEIYEIQAEIKNRVRFMNELFRQTQVPLAKDSNSPIFFVAVGTPEAGYNLNKRIIDEGFFVNLGVFPAAPIKNTGIRMTVSRVNHMEDIKGLVDAVAYHHPLAIEEAGLTQKEVRRAFGLPYRLSDANSQPIIHPKIRMREYRSIENIDRSSWDAVFGMRGNFDWEALRTFEKAYRNEKHERPEDLWDFFYFEINDVQGQPIIKATITIAIQKDDLLAPQRVSLKLEEQRQKTDPYFMTSKVLTLGSFITEGDHLFLDQKHPHWKDAMDALLGRLSTLREEVGASNIFIRDIEMGQYELKDYLISKGYLTVEMPSSCVVEELPWENEAEYLASRNKRQLEKLKRYILKYSEFYNVQVVNSLPDIELREAYSYYKRVSARNFDLNPFDAPFELFKQCNESEAWEWLVLRIKPSEGNADELGVPVAYIINYVSQANVYVPTFIGMDYSMQDKYGIYRQALYQVLLRAIDLKCKRIHYGLSAVTEKRRIGAHAIPKLAFLQAVDNYSLEFLESVSEA